jgi:dTDP-4-dehydrorhamnose reductase
LKIAVIGISGMLGSTAFRLLSQRFPGRVVGTARSAGVRRFFPGASADDIVDGVDADDPDSLSGFLAQARPAVVINCVGVNDPLSALPINAMLPHRLARLCALSGARLIHVSTDCVFSGLKGDYRESDPVDVQDVYGLSKYLGEVNYPNAITLRTSIIGPELASANGLVEWFLSRTGSVKGYRRAIFSGLTTDELTNVIVAHVLPNATLHGLYHVSMPAICKFDLLHLVKDQYDRSITIEPYDDVKIDRSLNSERFRSATGYRPPDWPTSIARMKALDVMRTR